MRLRYLLGISLSVAVGIVSTGAADSRLRLGTKVTIDIFLTAVVWATGPWAYEQSNTAIAAPSARSARSLSTDGGSYRVTLETCKRLIAGKKFTEARRSCTWAVSLAEALPATAWHERSVAYSTRGRAESNSNDADDAAQDFRKAADIDRKNLKYQDPALATDYANLGRAQLQLGDLENLNFADQSFQKAVEVLEVNLLNDPSRRSEYNHTLKGILLDYVRVKQALGQESLALALEQQSRSIR